MQHDYDVSIIGAGMAGASLACALAPSGLRIGIIEPAVLNNDWQPSYDDRGITLSPSSQRILDSIGVWQKLVAEVTPIKQIHISEQGRFGITHLNATDMGRSELGYVVIAKALGQALHAQLTRFDNVELICPAELKQFNTMDSGVNLEVDIDGKSKTISSKLLVGCDGSHSLVRRLAGINTKQKDFKQTAIVANVTTQRPNNGTAYERFRPQGPIALLPIDTNKSVLVFMVNNDDEQHYVSKSDSEFIADIETEFGRRLGKIEYIGSRRAYPIIFIEAVEHFRKQIVLLGNAAHTIHPNAAQGFNLGLRDVAGLAECLLDSVEKGIELNDVSILQNYLKLRQGDQQRIMQFTNAVAACFYNRLPLLSANRSLGLLLLDFIPVIRSSLVEMTMGLAGTQPRMVREM